MRYLILAMLATICAGAELEPQTIPELLGQTPVKFTAEEVVSHVRVMNPGAKVLIYYIDDPIVFNWFLGLPDEDAGYILGLFREHQNGTKDIAVLGKWSREDGVLLHEFVHLLESEIPERREEIRRTFQKLFSPEFNLGAMDLSGPAEPDAEFIKAEDASNSDH